MQDTTQSILNSAKRFFSGTMLSRLSGLLRDIVMAYAFGTHASVAAFLEAFRFSHLLRRLFGEGALQTVFAPHFEKFRSEDKARAGLFFRDLCVSLTAILGLIILIVMLALGGWLVLGNLNEDNQEILWLTFLMMPSLLFICLYGANAALLQCEKSFFVSSAAPIALNLIWTGSAFYLKDITQTSAMPWLATSIIMGCVAQWAVTLPKTWRILKELGNQKSISWFSPDIRTLAKPLALGMLGIAASQINSGLDVIFARYADIQGPALLWYAIRLHQLPLALFGIALSGALLPPLSRAAKGGDLVKFKQFLTFALQKSCILMIPVTCALLLLGDRCIDLIYGRGDFGITSTVATTYCLWGYVIGLIPMTLVLVLAPAFYAQNEYRIPTSASLISMGVNAALNSWFILGLHLGPSSVAFATSLSAWLNLFLLLVAFKRNWEFSYGKLLISIGKTVGLSASALILVLSFDYYCFESISSWQIFKGLIPHYSGSFIVKGAQLAIGLCVFGLVILVDNFKTKSEQALAKTSEI